MDIYAPEIIKFDALSNIYKIVDGYKKIVIVSGDGPEIKYFTDIYNSIKQNADIVCKTINIPQGEECKSSEILNMLWDLYSKLCIDRSSLIISVGGGSVSDVVGLSAATFKRGVDYVCVPTTLLSMTDASIGGKRAINNANCKNIIGCFYAAKVVYIDISVLDTLSGYEFINGLCEISKIALLNGDPLIKLLMKSTGENLSNLHNIIKLSIEAKQDIVKGDFLDKDGTRIVLNYGHTLAHMIESSLSFEEVSHGQAVALGMDFIASCFSDDSTYTSQRELFDKLKISKYFTNGINLLKSMDIDSLCYYVLNDKKCLNNKLNIVYLENIGKPKIKSITYDILKSSLLKYINK